MLIKLKRKLFYILILFSILGLAYKFIILDKYHSTISPNENSSTSILNEDVIIDKIRSTKKLISLESDLKQSITLDQSWGTIDAFKKVQKIDFYGKGNYIIDLSAFSQKDITLNKDENEIIVIIPKPIINDIFIDKEKTIYYTTDNGLLRFGDITFSTSDYSYVEKKVLSKMKIELESTKLYEKAEYSSKEQIRSLIETLYNNDNLDIKVELK